MNPDAPTKLVAPVPGDGLREEFEAWALTLAFDLTRDKSVYLSPETMAAWIGFKAARRAGAAPAAQTDAERSLAYVWKALREAGYSTSEGSAHPADVIRDMNRRLEAAPAAGVPQLPRFRHKKRRTVYEVVGEARVQAEGIIEEDDVVVVYRNPASLELWARRKDEFHDGRFEPVAAAPSPPSEPPARVNIVPQVERYIKAVVRLFEIPGPGKLTIAQRNVATDQEAYEAFTELNEAGKRLRMAARILADSDHEPQAGQAL